MASISVTRNYADGEVLVQADLDAFLDDIETFINTTKLNDDNLQNNGITGSLKLLNQSVTEAKLASNAVTTLKLAADAVTTAKILDSNVTTAKIADSNVTTAKLADLATTTAKINDLAVTTGKLADDAVTAAKLADDAVTDANRAVTTNHVRDSAITTAKLNDNAVTRAKVNPYYTSATVSTTSISSGTSAITIGNLTVTGRPVGVFIHTGAFNISVSSGSWSFSAGLQYSSDNSSWSTLKTIINFPTASNGAIPFGRLDQPSGVSTTRGGSITHFHTPSAGTAYYRFTVTATNNVAGSATFSVSEAIGVEIMEL